MDTHSNTNTHIHTRIHIYTYACTHVRTHRQKKTQMHKYIRRSGAWDLTGEKRKTKSQTCKLQNRGGVITGQELDLALVAVVPKPILHNLLAVEIHLRRLSVPHMQGALRVNAMPNKELPPPAPSEDRRLIKGTTRPRPQSHTLRKEQCEGKKKAKTTGAARKQTSLEAGGSGSSGSWGAHNICVHVQDSSQEAR